MLNGTRCPRHARVALCCLAAWTPLAAQPPASPADAPDRRARTLVRLLELDSQRSRAVAGLLRIGAPAVPALVGQLDDPRPEVVRRALHVLGWLGHSAAAAVPALDERIAGNPKDPALRWARGRIQPLGITLIADYSANTLREVGADGKVSHQLTGLPGVFDADRLPGGGYLIVEYQAKRVREISRDGDEVWVYRDAKGPLDADRLPNGNTLISDREGKRVVEVDPAGKVVWQREGDGSQEADRLPDGNTLICYYSGKVVEVDPAGAVVWELELEKGVSDADRLPNGNTLVTMYLNSTVREYTPEGEVVFEITGLVGASDADRLPNGSTLVADRRRAVEYDPDGKVVWSSKTGYAGQVNRY